jgi:head-tail adaptor
MAAVATGAPRNEKILIEAPVNAPDGFGGFTVTWATHATAWVAMRPVQAREDERQGAQRASCIYLISGLRAELATMTSDMRVNWRGTYLNIREIRLPPEASLMMEFTAETGVAM